LTTVLGTGYDILSTPNGIENPLAFLPQLLSLVTDCWKLDTRLNAFYKRLEKSTPGPVYWSRLSNGFNASISVGDAREGSGDVFPVAFQFEDLEMARTCAVYWASLAILWSGMKYIYSILSPVASFLPLMAPGASLPPLEHRTDIIPLAKNICQSVEYMISQIPESGTSGATPIVFPLKVATEIFGDGAAAGEKCERELEWAKNLMVSMGKGLRLLNNIDGPVERHTFIPSPDVDEGWLKKNVAKV
jgi:hypothetical protein